MISAPAEGKGRDESCGKTPGEDSEGEDGGHEEGVQGPVFSREGRARDPFAPVTEDGFVPHRFQHGGTNLRRGGGHGKRDKEDISVNDILPCVHTLATHKTGLIRPSSPLFPTSLTALSPLSPPSSTRPLVV